MPENFPQMQNPIKGISTELARMAGKTPEEMRSYILAHPGEYDDTEFRSAQRAENKIRAMNRREKELPQHNISKERF